MVCDILIGVLSGVVFVSYVSLAMEAGRAWLRGDYVEAAMVASIFLMLS